MTQPELVALVEIINRCPMTQAERMWLQALIAREEAGMQEPGPTEDDPAPPTAGEG